MVSHVPTTELEKILFGVIAARSYLQFIDTELECLEASLTHITAGEEGAPSSPPQVGAHPRLWNLLDFETVSDAEQESSCAPAATGPPVPSHASSKISSFWANLAVGGRTALASVAAAASSGEALMSAESVQACESAPAGSSAQAGDVSEAPPA